MVDLSVNIAGIKLKNPVITASGTYGFGEEFADFLDIQKLGGIVVKGTTDTPRQGNPAPRLAETPSGLLNAVGLQNKGVDHLIKEYLPKLAKLNTAVIVNVNGSTAEEYAAVIQKLRGQKAVAALELNISCPNVKQGGMAYGTDSDTAAELVSCIKPLCDKPLIVKLTPNVTDIAAIAQAVEAAGADAVSLINTLLGMAIDTETQRPKLSTITGGLSGAAVKPIALRMVWQVAKAVKIPVIGMGGISSWQDAVEFLLAGASAVAVGTANFQNPLVTLEIIDGLEKYLVRKDLNKITDIVGKLKV
ncbi:dihydroorotate dehydrogenase catalytic subunit [Candidatus Termititenax dinenymphae]|uniref:Dihydroorotate dehydrogenase n=1 Tax=Candidatus Termititenax dinenymphae TaxID=2218523 RepID=A0A388TL38_9BACT|nr:dihydroorotate dehydrogenase catalytic subunit [Candidatus Termititenax dinenymphae]